MTTPVMPNEFPDRTFDREPPPTPTALIEDLLAEGVSVDASPRSRAQHGRDWWPLTIREVAQGTVTQWPSVVARPTSASEVSAVLRVASAHRCPVTAQGGRSGVVGGAAAPTGAIALDLTGLDRIGPIDAISGTVTVDAGVFGPQLETVVRELGWTVGHFPQSFELATVGGWLACRGAGQYSNRYGKIEDIVRGLTVVLADGRIVELGGRGPRQAVGPDLVQLFVGSEGALGVITSATLVLHPLPASERRAAYGFATFREGLDACRRIMQRDARPAVLRLYDDVESKRSFQLESCALIVLDEGDPALVDATMSIVAQECSNATALDDTYVATWLEHRNDVGALAPLWEGGIVVDTLEVAGPWSVLDDMHHLVVSRVRALTDTLVVSVHQSHAYLDGACLYFTFAGRPAGDPTAYYRAAWDEASRAVLECGGALSHHHGIGRNRARFVADALGSAFPLLSALKTTLDPDNIMNPGVLGIGGPPW